MARVPVPTAKTQVSKPEDMQIDDDDDDDDGGGGDNGDDGDEELVSIRKYNGESDGVLFLI